MRLSSNFYDYYAETASRASANFHQSAGDNSPAAGYDYFGGSCANTIDNYRQKTDNLEDVDSATGGSAAEVDSGSTNTTHDSLKYQFLFVSPYVRKYKPEVGTKLLSSDLERGRYCASLRVCVCMCVCVCKYDE